MPNSTCVHDHHFGAIEAAIRETARGRAFLADYARKVRQSDTLTMLATIARLERWCADQAVRLAELERRDQALGDRSPENQALSGPALMIGDGAEDQVFFNEPIDGAGGNPAGVDQSLEVRGRIEHLASAFCDFDRRAADVARHRRATGPVAEPGLPVRVAPFEEGVGALTPHPHPGAAYRPRAGLPRAGGDQHALEEDVLDGIAKALGTRQTVDGW